jgi:hydroxypyruvate reductase
VVRPEQRELNHHFVRFNRDLPAIFRAAIGASSATRLLDAALALPEDRAFLDRPIHLISVGKASAPMASVLDRPGLARVEESLVVGTHLSAVLSPSVTWMASGHPVPDRRSVEAGQRAVALAQGVPADHGLLVLLSGGASSLLALPRAGITLDDKQATTRGLLLAGADIHALNTVRKHLSAIKGGHLAAATSAATLALVLSDVVGDDLSVIGSGPTVHDPSTFAGALEILGRFGGVEVYPAAVVALLRAGARGDVAETPKPGDGRLARVTTRVIGSRASAAAGAAVAAESLGYRAIVHSEPVVGAAREAGPRFVADAVRLAGVIESPTCVIGTGETTVQVTGCGRGGRNQELALSVAGLIAGLKSPAAFLSAGTDGIDGPTDAAGAMCDRTTLHRGERAGLGVPDDYFRENDSYAFFQALGDLVITGPTDTNVGDIQILLLAPARDRQ